MREKIFSAKYIFMLIFLLVFNFTDIVTYTSSTPSITAITFVMLCIPIIYSVYHINVDDERLPRHLKYIGATAASIYLFRVSIDSLVYLLTYFGGESNVYLIWNYRFILLILFIILLYALQYVKFNEKIISQVISILFTLTIFLIIMMTLVLYLPSKDGVYMLGGDFGLKYLMEIFLPLLFLPFLKLSAKDYRYGMSNAALFYGVLLASITYLISNLSKMNSNHLFFNSYFIDFININFNQYMAGLILLTSITINIIMAVVIYIWVNEYMQSSGTSSKYSTIKSGILILTINYFFIIVYARDSFDFINTTHDVYIITQVILMVTMVAFSFYLGFKKYIGSRNKMLLYILSTFPLLYTLWYLNTLNSPLIRILGEQIRRLNYVFLIFSTFVLLYYTLETLSLWYAYNKRINTFDLEQTPVEKDLHIYVMIPCMNEDVVINNTVRSVLNNQYPNLHVNVIDDASDDNTVAEVLKVKDDRLNLMRRIKPEAQQGKGEALNWAYYQLIKEIDQAGIPHEDVLITIIDADTDIDTDYFAKVNYVFNSRRTVTGLQSKVRVIDLEEDSAQDLEFAEIINSSQSLRNIVGTVAFGGNGQFCRLSTLESLDEKPWSDSLVEDFDLSTRLYLKNGDAIHNIQINDIYIRQTGIKDDSQSLVKQRVRWAQGNVQSFKYVKEIIKSKLLDKRQKTELIATLMKPWLMAIEYVILIYTLVLIIDIIILDGISRTIILVTILFIIMAFYILTTNLVWSILYNRQKDGPVKLKNVLSDTYYLTKFLFTLTQIYPQSIIRFFKSENGWDKTKRQVKE